MIEIYGATFAQVTEVKRGTLVRLLACFHVVVYLPWDMRTARFVSGLTTGAR